MMELTQLIAAAWREEREKHVILTGHVDPEARLWLIKELTQGDAGPVLAGTESACQAHLDSLCAAAVEKALKDAGIACVPVEPTGGMLSAGFDARHEYETGIYRAMITAAQEADR